MTSEDIQRAFHYLYPSELPALKMLAQSLPDSPLIVNVGAGSGTSGLAFVESRPDATLVTFDIQDESSPFGCLEAERDVINRAGLYDPGRHWQFCLDSKIAGREWITRGFGRQIFGRNPNMVFIDGDHSYEGCKGDIEAWMPHLVPGGIMAVHDYRKEDLQPDPNGPHPKPWPGVDSAVNELLIPNFEMIMHIASLVAFRKGE